MSGGAVSGRAPAAANPASSNAWLIAVLVALATFMEVLDTTIANVVLTYIAGDMGVSTDEASWVVTTYLVANAVSLTASPWKMRNRSSESRFQASAVAIEATVNNAKHVRKKALRPKNRARNGLAVKLTALATR